MTYIPGGAIAAPAGALTGTTLAANVVTSSLTTIGTLIAGAVPASLVTAGTFGAGAYVMPSTLAMTKELKLQSTTVSGLTAAATAGVGAVAFVTDSNANAVIGLGNVVGGGGTNKVVVYSDGSNWLVL